MKSVDEPESPDLLARRPDGGLRGAARRQSATSSRSISRRKEIVNLTNDEFADYGPTLLARRQVHRLQRARQRQPEAVPARSRHEEEDAAHLRHAGRDRRAVHRRPHARLLVDGHRPGRAARAGGREERQHLQHLDARSEDRRAAAVHRRARRQLLAGRAERRADQPDRLRQLLQGRVQHPHARAQGAAAHGGQRRLRRARPDHRLPGAAAAHAGRGQRSARRARSRRCSSRDGRR